MKKKRQHPIDELLGMNAISMVAQLNKMAKHFEKTQKKKIVFALFSVISEDGRAIYQMSNLEKSRKYIPKLEEHLKTHDAMIEPSVRKHLAATIPFSFIVKQKEEDNAIS